ncbi:MAG: RNB domain-containing ribonuclease [Opitutus sp.]|nr:RNB domain-containing ribonuclease [Opitutus sp.]
MSIRDRLLALVRTPDFSPANEFELARRLDLNKKQRASLAHELRLILKTGEFVRGGNGRIARRGAEPSRASKVESRAIFAPTPRAGRSPQAAAQAPAAGKTKPASRPASAPPKLRPNELVGRIQFRAGGSAFVVRDSVDGEAAEPALQVFPEDTGIALPGDRVLAREFPGRKGRRAGEKIGGIVRVLERARDTIVGELRRGRRGFLVQADDPRFSYEIAVADPAKSGLTPRPKEGDKVVVKLAEWRRRDEPITGTITDRLGRTHEPRAELLGIFIKHNLATKFPAEVEREAAALPDRVQPREAAHRLDYRDRAVFTIDPDDAKDFDDALSYEVLDAGEVRVGIHIADVSAYVRAGTALDREAQRRGNSTYLVGVVIPMLPEKLSNGLCSLVEAQDRLCKAVFLTFGRNGKFKDTTYANTIICSRKRLTYKQAYAFMFQPDLERIRALPLPPKHQTGSTGRALRELTDSELRDLQTWIQALWKIASQLRGDRMAHGSLDLDMPETKIYVDENGYADRLEKIEHDESHQLIEEFMLAANEAVARLTRTRSLPSLYRVHDEPDAEKLAEYRELLGTFGIPVGDLTQRAELVRLLVTLRTHPQGYTLRTQLLRSLKKAAYRAKPDGHFGLHKKDYSHFTSPIRRYADLVVHRVLEQYLARQSGHATARGSAYDLPRTEQLGEHLSLTEISSAEAERESVKIKLLEFFEREVAKKPKTRFAAIITDVRANGVFIELTESMTFGFVAAANLGDDNYTLADDGSALVGRRRKKRFELNGRLDVVVERVDRYKRLIDFCPVA